MIRFAEVGYPSDRELVRFIYTDVDEVKEFVRAHASHKKEWKFSWIQGGCNEPGGFTVEITLESPTEWGSTLEQWTHADTDGKGSPKTLVLPRDLFHPETKLSGRIYLEDFGDEVVSDMALNLAEDAGFLDGSQEPPVADFPMHPKLSDAYRRGWLRRGIPYP